MAPTRRTPKAKPALELPTKKSTPSEALQDYVILLYGREKIGKTTLVAQFPDVLFLCTEPGTRALSVYETAINSWKDFVAYINLLEQEPERFRNVCVDTVDLLFDMCEAHVCERLAINHPSEEEWGKGWGALKKEFSAQVARLSRSGRGVIFTSHARFQEVKTRQRGGGQQTRDVVQPTMSNGARRVIEPMADIWAYYDFDGDDARQLYIQGADAFSAGNRLRKRFLDPATGEQMARIPMGASAEEAYANFLAAFQNKLSPAKPQASARRVARKRK